MDEKFNIADYRGWISRDIDIDVFTNQIFSELVLGTPAYNRSSKGRDLYDYYAYHNPGDYASLKQDLFGEVDFHSFSAYKDLRTEMLKNKNANFCNALPEILQETIYIFRGDVYKNKFCKNYFSQVATVARGQRKKEMENICDVERFFFHLRNGFAHGNFAIVEKSGKRYYVIQDESNGQISARIILKQDTLQKWISYLYKRKKELDGVCALI